MKKILIIGAGFLQDFVIRKAKQLGYETLAVDGNPDAVGLKSADKYSVVNIVDEEACLEYAKKEQVDGVLTAATDFGVLSAAYVAENMGLPGISYETAKLIKNKYLVRKRLYEFNVDDMGRTYEVDANTDLYELGRELNFPVIVKPCDGSGSRGVTEVASGDKLADACSCAMAYSITRRAVIEPFVKGREYGAESLVVNGEVHVLSVMRKWMTEPPYYAELGHAVPTDLAPAVEARAKKCVENAIRALGIEFGSVNMDMLISSDGKIHIVDVGARMGGNMIGPCVIPYGTGIDYMANMIKNAVGDETDWNESEHGTVATRLLAFGGGVIKQLPDFETLEKQYGVEIYHHMKVGQVVNKYRTNLDGCGYIIATASSTDMAASNAEAVLNEIRKTIF